MNESEIQTLLRIKASEKGWRLWRNNVGAGKLDNGAFVRWGLANDSTQMNRYLKSADLIGIRPVLITQDMVGTVIGQFVSREVKQQGWVYEATQHEQAQHRWLSMINYFGGDATFTTGEL